MTKDSSTRDGLVVDGMSAGYEAGPVVHDISLEVERGSVVALLGPNGAGKTTIVRAISNLISATGSRRIGGQRLDGLPPNQVVASGVAHVPQGRQLFGHSTGYENLCIGAYSRRDRAAVDEDIEAFLDAWPLARRVIDQPAGFMSGGEQQVIAIGRALMSRPRFLLLDEPSLGLAPILVNQLYGMLPELTIDRHDRLGILLVEQNVRKALEISQKAHVVVGGRIVRECVSSDTDPSDVVALFMGAAKG